MGLRFGTRASDSPWVDTVWTCTSEHVAEMTSVATACWGLVFFEREGRAHASLTGLAQGAVRQIERAREAAALLAAGVPVAGVVSGLEYFDEPHLARALRRYVGRTARQLREGTGGAIGLDLNQPVTS